jgi:hypothetical protein
VRVIVCGGRTYGRFIAERKLLRHTLDDHQITELVNGGAGGADYWARHWTKLRGIPVTTINAEWDKFGLHAGPIRNTAMLKLKPDLVIAFPGGKGTADMVRQARAAGVPVKEIE